MLALSVPGYLMSVTVKGGGGGHMSPCKLEKYLIHFNDTLLHTLQKYAICLKFGLAEIICSLCTKLVILQIIGHCVVAWTISIECATCMSSESCCT